GDGHSGNVATVIEVKGVTSLAEGGNNFYSCRGGSGPSLKYCGADVEAGQFGTWVPIGAEKTASGYEVAWHNTSTGQYTVWNTDSNGNYLSNAIGAVSGSSAALESLEPSFQQDLNGDGQIGVPSMTNAATAALADRALGNDTFIFKSTMLAEVARNAASADNLSFTTESTQLHETLNDMQISQLQSVFEASNGHDTDIHFANNDVITPTKIAEIELHANTF